MTNTPTDPESETLHRAHLDLTIEVDGRGWMHGPAVTVVPSVRTQALWPGETHILGIVWHYTDTRSVGAVNMAQRIAGQVAGGRAASWHICIDRAGRIAQSVSMMRGSWHAGGASAARFGADPKLVDGHRVWRLMSADHRQLPGANSLFAGIELENVGEVRLVGGEWLGWPFKRGTQYGDPVVVPADEVLGPNNGAHHCYTSAQIAAAREVASALASKYALLRENCGWSHQQIDPENRTDPGPLWMGGSALPSILDTVWP